MGRVIAVANQKGAENKAPIPDMTHLKNGGEKWEE